MPFPPNPHMATALQLASEAAAQDEVPVGAVLIGPDGQVLAQAHNLTRTLPDPTAHAEILVIREGAQRLGSERLLGCTLVVTLEPCPMCAAAISEARIAKLIYAASDPKGGGVEYGPQIFKHSRNKPEVISGISEAEAAQQLKDFFAAKRG